MAVHGAAGAGASRYRVVRSTNVPIAELLKPEDQVALPVARDGAVVGLGRPLADHDLRRTNFLPRPACVPVAPAAPVRCASTRSAHAAARRGLAHRATGRSPRARSASMDHRGTRPGAGCAICSGLHDLAQRRSFRRPWRRPIQRTSAQAPGRRPVWRSSRRDAPARSPRNASFAASFETFGRLARRSACHCAVVARYDDRVATRRRVAAQLPRDRRGRPAQPASDLAHTHLLGIEGSRSLRAH